MSGKVRAGLRFASAETNEPLLQDAIHRLEARLRPQLGETAPDLALVFFSTHFRLQAQELGDELRLVLTPRLLIGCSAEGVLGAQAELEEQPAIAVLAARLPEADITPFYLPPEDGWVLLDSPETLRQAVQAPQETKLFILLGDPFSTPVEDVLRSFERAYPEIPVVGGMASAADEPGSNRLIMNEQVESAGLVGLALAGDFEIDLVVSQGCRPIGAAHTVTAAQRNVIQRLDGEPALFVIHHLLDELSEEEQEQLNSGLLIGRAANPQREQLGRGDFLVRAVIGVDRQSGAIAVSDVIQPGERVQFHLRDALTAKEDLEMMLIPQTFRAEPQGGLLFTCNGRGRRLYDHPDGDISVIKRSLGKFPLAGFFCAGEIGPVGGKNHLHGHTAVLVTFRSGSPGWR